MTLYRQLLVLEWDKFSIDENRIQTESNKLMFVKSSQALPAKMKTFTFLPVDGAKVKQPFQASAFVQGHPRSASAFFQFSLSDK